MAGHSDAQLMDGAALSREILEAIDLRAAAFSERVGRRALSGGRARGA